MSSIRGTFYPDVIPSALTASRVSDDPAFTYVGVDFAGPLYVKRTPYNQESHLTKMYLTLFTCASSRAVHLDLKSRAKHLRHLLNF